MLVPTSRALAYATALANPGGRAMIIVGIILVIAAFVVLGGIFKAFGSLTR